jgi:hypothetical protein
MVTMDLGLFHLMEDFILKEVDYSQEYGYSSRAKRFMKRKLNKELTPFLEKNCKCKNSDTISDIDTDSEVEFDSEESVDSVECENDRFLNERTIVYQHKWIDFCYGFTYACVVGTVYGSIFYIVYSYSKCKTF